ncbi:MAG TPA: hypothetical protein VFG14_09850 [Chthoniobacteraceae bacterium]|jgi:hypothetical protein|nr:hypothetical protein [Chthoniobacteraceae bacterium]
MKTLQQPESRRQFLADVGKGMITAAVGYGMATELGLAAAAAEEPTHRLEFGVLEPLVRLMQETPASKLLPILTERIRSGTELRELVAAGALANARTFGGEDYVGFHTMMALAPSYHMAQELPTDQRALPVFKVLYRNTNRIQESGGGSREVLYPVSEQGPDCRPFRDLIHERDAARADAAFAAAADLNVDNAFDALLQAVEEDTEVHRVVLPYRAWDLLGIIGREHATTLLRQSVRYCVRAEQWRKEQASALLPRVLEEYKLLDAVPGMRQADDAWVEELSRTIFKSTPEQAASAAAYALAEGMLPDTIGEAISLATNQLILRDQGRRPAEEVSGKPIGSVHGDSIGVHASDSANAWRNLARVARPRNTFACLILGAYQAALDRTNRGGDFANWQPLPLTRHVEEVKPTDLGGLIGELETAIRGNLQARAMGVVQRIGDLGHDSKAVMDVLRGYAISEDGALHGEKFYRTVSEESALSRPAFKWRYLCALARVTASEYGRPAPGVAEARELLK